MPKQYLPEFKSQVVLAIQKGLPIVAASQQYDVVQSTLYRWMRDAVPATDLPIGIQVSGKV